MMGPVGQPFLADSDWTMGEQEKVGQECPTYRIPGGKTPQHSVLHIRAQKV